MTKKQIEADKNLRLGFGIDNFDNVIQNLKELEVSFSLEPTFAGEKDSYAYFSMRFYCIDNAGHIGVEINLEENVSTVYRQEEKDKLKLEIIVVPSTIDNFQKELLKMALNEDGVATLYGQHSNPDNT